MLLAAALLCMSPTLALGGSDPSLAMKAGDPLKIGVGNYPPLEFHDPATNRLTGFDVELGEALAARLGVRPEWHELGFEAMLPALQTGRIDAIISGMTDLGSRHEAASFVDYLRCGPQFFVEKSREAEFKEVAALCGHTVGASRRSSFPKEVADWSEAHCGDRSMTVVGMEGSADARSQLKQGRIDAAVQGGETLPYLMAQEPGAYALVGSPLSTHYDGIAISKDDRALQAALTSALDALIADGTYGALLAKWHLEANGIAAAAVNAGR